LREKLNDNPIAQIALVGVLLLVVVVVFMKSMGGGEEGAESEPSTPAAAAPELAEVPPVAVGSSEFAPGQPPTISAATSAVAAPAAHPMPKKVEKAYSENKTIALLIVRDGGVDDHLVRDATEVLEGRSHVAFFSAKAKHIARFAQITGPLGVNQAPALVVIRPKHLNGNGPAPASVTYGFQTKQDVRQSIRDAVYRGRTLTYAPN
jgi:hypothetical protein